MVYQEPKTLPTNKTARKNYQKKSLRGRTRQEHRRRITGQVHCLSNETNCLDLQEGCPKIDVSVPALFLTNKRNSTQKFSTQWDKSRKTENRARQDMRRRIAGQVHCLSNETNCLDLQDGCPKFSVCSLASLLSQKTKYQKLKIYKQQAVYDKNVCG